MMPILTDNARLLSAAYRNLSAAQKESNTEVRQDGATFTLRSWKNGRVYRNSFTAEVRDDAAHDRYTTEVRDVTAMMVADGEFIVQSDNMTLRFKAVDEIVSRKELGYCVPGPRPPSQVAPHPDRPSRPDRGRHAPWDPHRPPRPCPCREEEIPPVPPEPWIPHRPLPPGEYGPDRPLPPGGVRGPPCIVYVPYESPRPPEPPRPRPEPGH